MCPLSGLLLPSNFWKASKGRAKLCNSENHLQVSQYNFSSSVLTRMSCKFLPWRATYVEEYESAALTSVWLQFIPGVAGGGVLIPPFRQPCFTPPLPPTEFDAKKACKQVSRTNTPNCNNVVPLFQELGNNRPHTVRSLRFTQSDCEFAIQWENLRCIKFIPFP